MRASRSRAAAGSTISPAGAGAGARRRLKPNRMQTRRELVVIGRAGRRQEGGYARVGAKIYAGSLARLMTPKTSYGGEEKNRCHVPPPGFRTMTGMLGVSPPLGVMSVQAQVSGLMNQRFLPPFQIT